MLIHKVVCNRPRSKRGSMGIAGSLSVPLLPAAAPKGSDMPYITRAPLEGAPILERLPAVKARTGLSRSEIYRRIATVPPTFPTPIKIGERASAWDSREIDRWIADRIAERDGREAA